MNKEQQSVPDILTENPELFVASAWPAEAEHTQTTENSAPSGTEGAPKTATTENVIVYTIEEATKTTTTKRSIQPDNLPGTSNYNWEKYGYTLITEETFEGGYHNGDYKKDGVMYCGYCHTPKQILHQWRGELHAFPINCRCKRECLARIQAEREQREQQEKALLARQHALPYPYMHQWTFAHDDGGSPQATRYFKDYVAHFAEARADGSGLFLFGPRAAAKPTPPPRSSTPSATRATAASSPAFWKS